MFVLLITSLIVGSFLNVCIYRIPRGESIAYPPSHCPKCDSKLKPIDLIPILSFIINKGKCRYCGEPISLQYPLIEALNAILYIILYLKFGFSLEFLQYALLSSLLIVISTIDYHYKIIPDKLIIFGIICRLLLITLYNFKPNIINGTIGLLIGGGIFLVIAIITNGAMGGGDIKLMAMLGLWLGWKYILLTTLLSFVIGAIISMLLLIFKVKSRKDFIPFGPFISIAAYIAAVYGNELIQFYINNILM
ncbi:prepilin peptidase [Caldisalinibacter kiritimatiensis]|uniref:Prepilin leader peptidase/N-methyltransferase n=1 Tax=Caldisalinibacter kiritimatiensis TaxID=1304284 RepID=R1CTU4_9FIRM|nr:A24 family peptidase [Caldisalinibacter kiritimatiensis]EOD00109.1 Leader peptidase (Prepilin peptidase) / N-methyltransferase [Caldisalinibacter kiritimatiensis]